MCANSGLLDASRTSKANRKEAELKGALKELCADDYFGEGKPGIKPFTKARPAPKDAKPATVDANGMDIDDEENESEAGTPVASPCRTRQAGSSASNPADTDSTADCAERMLTRYPPTPLTRTKMMVLMLLKSRGNSRCHRRTLPRSAMAAPLGESAVFSTTSAAPDATAIVTTTTSVPAAAIPNVAAPDAPLEVMAPDASPSHDDIIDEMYMEESFNRTRFDTAMRNLQAAHQADLDQSRGKVESPKKSLAPEKKRTQNLQKDLDTSKERLQSLDVAKASQGYVFIAIVYDKINEMLDQRSADLKAAKDHNKETMARLQSDLGKAKKHAADRQTYFDALLEHSNEELTNKQKEVDTKSRELHELELGVQVVCQDLTREYPTG